MQFTGEKDGSVSLVCYSFTCSARRGEEATRYWDAHCPSHTARHRPTADPKLSIKEFHLPRKDSLSFSNSSRLNHSTNSFLNIPTPGTPPNFYSSIHINAELWHTALSYFLSTCSSWTESLLTSTHNSSNILYARENYLINYFLIQEYFLCISLTSKTCWKVSFLFNKMITVLEIWMFRPQRAKFLRNALFSQYV